MSSAINPMTSSSSAAANSGSQAAANSPALDPLANEQTFLTLLVSQLQNQDPLNPTDSNQFVSQLTSYSQLEQLIQIRQNTTPASTSAAGTSTTSTGTSTTGTSTTGA